MRILLKLLKMVIVLAIAIPLGIIALSIALGILGAIVGLAILALKLACFALVGYWIIKLVRHLMTPAPTVHSLPAGSPAAHDPYYEAAMRELNAEMRTPPGR